MFDKELPLIGLLSDSPEIYILPEYIQMLNLLGDPRFHLPMLLNFWKGDCNNMM